MPIEIEQDADWDKHVLPDPPEDIESGGLGTCVSVFVYDTETKATYACHYSSLDPNEESHYSNQFESMIDAAFHDFRSSACVKVYVSGAIASEAGSIAKRRYVQLYIDSKKSSNVDVRYLWPESGVLCIQLILDPSTGILHEPKT